MLNSHDIAGYAGMIDHTLLKPFITNEDWKVLCEEAMKYGFKTVAINNAGISICKNYLDQSDVLVDAAVSFPLGQCTLETKIFETRDAIKKGAGEVDYVVNIVELKNGNWNYIEKEMASIVAVCREHGVTSKVIFETCYLTDDEKRKLCGVALKVQPDFVKTSTGFGTGGATIDDVRLMKSSVGDSIKVKASGGIRNAETFLAMIEAGALRIGTSSGIKIIEEFKGIWRSK